MRDNTGNGVVAGPGSLAVTRSTITTSGVGVSGAQSVAGSTITGNSIAGVAGTTTVTDSILSDNGGSNCSGTVADGGNNVNFPASDATCPTTFTQGDPKLDSLAQQRRSHPDDGPAGRQRGRGPGNTRRCDRVHVRPTPTSVVCPGSWTTSRATPARTSATARHNGCALGHGAHHRPGTDVGGAVAPYSTIEGSP